MESWDRFTQHYHIGLCYHQHFGVIWHNMSQNPAVTMSHGQHVYSEMPVRGANHPVTANSNLCDVAFFVKKHNILKTDAEMC